jgi:glycosyltransferase involved in cell wall biosynthesis
MMFPALFLASLAATAVRAAAPVAISTKRASALIPAISTTTPRVVEPPSVSTAVPAIAPSNKVVIRTPEVDLGGLSGTTIHYRLEAYDESGKKASFGPFLLDPALRIPPKESSRDEEAKVLSVEAGRATLDRFGLQSEQYILYVSRLEPENNALAVIQAYQQTTVGPKLVVVGDAPYAREYIATLRATADPRVVFTGGVYGDGYRELQCHALAYVQATEVGGTHPALVEAMGFGNCVLAHDTPEHREVLGEAGLFFDAHRPDTLAALLDRVVTDPALVDQHRALATARAAARYSWDRVTDQYEAILSAP